MDREILLQIAEKYKTPLYIFDMDEFSKRAKLVKDAFGEEVHLCYSIKANPFLLYKMPEYFSNFEVCSPGELTICEKMKVDMKKVIFSGVNKTLPDVERAIDDGVGILTAESLLHVELIQKAAEEREKTVSVLLRLTGGSQFGMDKEVLMDIVDRREKYPNLKIVGIHFFTGTQKKKLSVIDKELTKLDDFSKMLEFEHGFHVERIEYGTGLAVDYFSEDADKLEEERLQEVVPLIQKMGEKYHLTIEMGRFFAAPCGYYITKVIDVKTNKGYHYAICDGGMNQLKYDGQMKGMQTPPICVLTNEEKGENAYTLCGSLCTTSDVLATIHTGKLEPGDLLSFGRTGAYSVMEGMAVFLSREMPAVVCYSKEQGTVLVRDFINTDLFNTPNYIN